MRMIALAGYACAAASNESASAISSNPKLFILSFRALREARALFLAHAHAKLVDQAPMELVLLGQKARSLLLVHVGKAEIGPGHLLHELRFLHRSPQRLRELRLDRSGRRLRRANDMERADHEIDSVFAKRRYVVVQRRALWSRDAEDANFLRFGERLVRDGHSDMRFNMSPRERSDPIGV